MVKYYRRDTFEADNMGKREVYDMKKDKYIAYVGTYTHGSSEGIHLYDLNVEQGEMMERKVIPIKNPSHLTQSKNGRFLYSIADEGVEAFKILPDGDLASINKVGIDGMRGCYLSTDEQGKYLFAAGYHDGKVTVLSICQDGSLGQIREGIFHRGLGSVAERNFRPHVNCVQLTPDGKYLCAVDNGIDHIKIYHLNKENGKLKLVDILRCELESAPRLIIFSEDGRFAYLISELSNEIRVFTYDGSGELPQFESIQCVKTFISSRRNCAASGMKLSRDGEYLYCSSAGDNTASIFKVDKKTGRIERICVLPVSGYYPKDVDVFPDNRHLIALNHESNEIKTFAIDYENKIFLQKGRPLKIETPNCILISKLY
jgi:6-phosphogluconolactonase